MRRFLLSVIMLSVAVPAWSQSTPGLYIINPVTPTSKSGTITLGGTSQTLMAANASRVGCSIQPQSGDVWINTTGSAAGAIQPSIYLPAPSVFTCPSGFRGAITIFGTTTGTTFAAEEDTVP